MMKRLQQRAEAAARKQQRRRIARIFAAVAAAAPQASVEATETGVKMSGRSLVKRWLSDPALRFAGTVTK